MTTIRRKQLESLTEDFFSDVNDSNIILLYGAFGIGKSEFLDALINKLNKEKYADAFCRFDFHFDREFLVEYLNSSEFSVAGSEVVNISSGFDETAYNKKHLGELLKIVQTADEKLADDLLSQYSLKYFDFEDKDNPDNKKIERQVKSIIDKKGEQRFLLKHERVIAESFLVDLMNFFYPLDDKNFPHYEAYLANIQSPIRLFFIFDNIDTITYSVVKWLNDVFLPLLADGKFGDIISYEINDELKDVEISRFFDFRFIISSRINLMELDGMNYFRENNSRITTVELKAFDAGETKEYLALRQMDDADSELIYEFSLGLPFIIDLLIDYESDEINEVVRDSIYDTFTEKFLDGRPSVIREAIKMSAFIDRFEEDYLRFNHFIGDEYKETFAYLKFSNDLYSVESGKIALKKPFRKILAMSLERTNKSDVIKYQNIASLYGKTKSKYPELNSEKFDILRSLAYFGNFDTEYAIDMAFDDKSFSTKNFIKSHGEYFEDNLHTKSVKAIHRETLDYYNKLIDGPKYELKKKLIENIWKQRAEKLKKELNERQEELDELNKQAEVYSDDPSKLKQEYDLHQREFIEKENDLIVLRKKLGTYSYNKYIFSLIVNVTAAVMAFIIAYFFPDLFATPKNHSSIIIIQYVLYFLSIVFLLIAFNFTSRIVKAILDKKTMQKIEIEMQKVEDERDKHKTEMKRIKELLADWQKNVNQISTKIKQTEAEIKKLKEILNEPYTYKNLF